MEIDSVLVQSGYYVAGVPAMMQRRSRFGNVVRPNVVAIAVHQGADRPRLDLAAELKATFAAPVAIVAETSDGARGVEVSALASRRRDREAGPRARRSGRDSARDRRDRGRAGSLTGPVAVRTPADRQPAALHHSAACASGAGEGAR